MGRQHPTAVPGVRRSPVRAQGRLYQSLQPHTVRATGPEPHCDGFRRGDKQLGHCEPVLIVPRKVSLLAIRKERHTEMEILDKSRNGSLGMRWFRLSLLM